MLTGSAQFSKKQLEIFNAVKGAYSEVTNAEADKGHITTTGYEADLIKVHFGVKNIHVGAKKHNPAKATKVFSVYSDSEDPKSGSLTLNFPKPKKGELHIYMSKTEGFRPRAGDIWFVYEPKAGGNLCLGSMPRKKWEQLEKGLAVNEAALKEEQEDVAFQEIINSPVLPKLKTKLSTLKFPRDINVAKKAMKKAKFKCEYNSQHETFLSKATGEAYIECHHLVPLSKQGGFTSSLDVVANIVALCPNCHRKIHHAGSLERDEMLKALFEKRKGSLGASGINTNLDSLKGLYA